jgi:hypothetical protein
MCDYSLETMKSVPAEADETLQVTRFPAGTVGFAAPGCTDTATCVPEGTVLRAEIPNHDFGFAIEDVIMTRVAPLMKYQHHDAVRLEDGSFLTLQFLRPGTMAKVLMLADAKAPEDKGLASPARAEENAYID